MEYFFHVIYLLCIYIMLVLSANLTTGMANLLTMCQAAFYGIGAYIGTYFLFQFNISFLLIALIVMAVTGLSSLIISYASVKLKGDYFVLATMGFQLIVYTIIYNWTEVTHGTYGIAGIPGFNLAFGLVSIDGIYPNLILVLIATAAVIWFLKRLKSSPYGRLLKAIRTDGTIVESFGRNTASVKIWAFALSSVIAGLAGALYASYVGYIDPTSFPLKESIFILCALFIGGIGNIEGPICGAAFVILLPEVLRWVGLPDSMAAEIRQIIYGLALVLIMIFHPQGIKGKIVMK
jgi:ABC-type branched-chain amino acid transport system, permease component